MSIPLKPPVGGVLSWTNSTHLSLAPFVAQSEARSSNITSGSAIALNLTTTGAGALDTGTIAHATPYAIWALSGASGVTAVVSTAFVSSGVTKPTGYTTQIRRIGSFMTDPTDAVVYAMTQNGTSSDRDVLFDNIPHTNTTALTAGASLTAAPVDCSAFVPSTATDVLVSAYAVLNADPYTVNYGITGTSAHAGNLVHVATADIVQQTWVALDSLLMFEYIVAKVGMGATAGTLTVNVLGYRESL